MFRNSRSPTARRITKWLAAFTNKRLNIWRNKNWQNYLTSVKPGENSLWKLHKKFTSAYNIIPPLKANNSFVYDNQGKAELLAKHFYNTHLLTESYGSQHHDKFIRRQVNKTLKRQDGKNFRAVSPKEVAAWIKKTNIKKAPGPDNISPILIKNLPRKAIINLTKIFNSCFRLKHFPGIWKTAKLMALPKPQKDLSVPSNYRPISLLNIFSKILEKLILTRLHKYLSNKRFFIHEQFGFRQKHSTVAQLARLTDHITKGFNEKKHTGLLLLDVEKAFDTVWHTGLIYKLIQIDTPTYLIHIIFSFLSNRSFYVTINSAKSSSQSIPAGVPQGSCLSPTLFNIYINDIPKPNDTTLSLFADDTAIYTSSYRIDTIVNRLQKSFSKIHKFCNKWKIKINHSKTDAIVFTKRRPYMDRNITIQNSIIPWADHIKYLGVTLDKRLTFTKHINTKREACSKLMYMMFPYFNRKSILSPQNKMILYKVIIRSVLCYACPVWSSTCKTNLNNMQRLQNFCLRIINNYPRYTKVTQMHNELDIPTLQEHIHALTERFFTQVLNSNNPLIADIGNYDKTSLSRYVHKRTKHILLANK